MNPSPQLCIIAKPSYTRVKIIDKKSIKINFLIQELGADTVASQGLSHLTNTTGYNGINVGDKKEILKEFRAFCEIDRRLSPRTVSTRIECTRSFLRSLNKDYNKITKDDIRSYLRRYIDKAGYVNQLSSLKVFFRDFLKAGYLVESFKFPSRSFKVKKIPSKKELLIFYKHLNRLGVRALFLIYATSGLRRNEALFLNKVDVDFEQRMILPKDAHITTRSKKSWCTFFNEEAAEILKKYLLKRKDDNPQLFPFTEHIFREECKTAYKKCGIKITPQHLRDWFCQEMGELGVSDRWIDAFCGRTPKSILARHYSDYSPERLKRIYDQAGLKVLS